MVLLAFVRKYREIPTRRRRRRQFGGTQARVQPELGKEWAHGTQQRHEGLVGLPMIWGIVRSLLLAAALLALALTASAGVRPL